MRITNSNLFIDADVLNKLMEIKKPVEEVINIIKNIFDGFGKQALVHHLVYAKEILLNQSIKASLVSRSIILVPNYEDIFSCSEEDIYEDAEFKKYLYVTYVKEFYHRINAKKLDISDEDVLKYWCAGQNLGESHSIAACILNNCSIFLSDDSHSKMISNHIREKKLGLIQIYTREDIVSSPYASNLNRTQKNAVSHK